MACLPFWSKRAKTVLDTFLTTESNVGLFLLVVMVALAIGLMIAALRWVIYELLLCRSNRLRPEDFGHLGLDEKRLEAFTAAVDAHYRYHQFWGGMSIAIPFLYGSWLYANYADLYSRAIGISFVALVLTELLSGSAAVSSYKNYVGRARRILTEVSNAKRMEEEE